MPQFAQPSYFAVRAWNVEIASVQDRAGSSALAAQLRLQWWKDALEQTENTQYDSHPVVRSVRRAMVRDGLPARYLVRMAEARESDQPIQTMQNLMDYAEDTWGSVLYLMLDTLGPGNEAADIAASHVAGALGIVTTLRAIPYAWRHGKEMMIPHELLLLPDSKRVLTPPTFQPHNGESEAPNRPDWSNHPAEHEEIWNEAIHTLQSTAIHHLMQARALQTDVPKELRPALLPAVPALHYLQEQDVFARRQDPQQRLSLLLSLGRSWLTRVF